jgi:hypothetical protein
MIEAVKITGSAPIDSLQLERVKGASSTKGVEMKMKTR